jgi:beta-lactamase class A
MKFRAADYFRRLIAALVLGAAVVAPTQVIARDDFETAFDNALGTELRAPRSYNTIYSDSAEQRLALIADGQKGRIGVAALDLTTGRQISVLGDQRFPMASTSKIAIAATFLDGVEKGKWSLSDRFPLMVPVASKPFSSKVAPVTAGTLMPAHELIELMITRSNNSATDALLAAVGGPDAVNRWVRKAGIDNFQLSRDIATLVRDDGEYDPATYVDERDSATPQAMTTLLSGIYKGRWLNAESRRVIIGAMERCLTGKRRIPAMLPAGSYVAHKTGSLNNTSSDIGIIQMPDGRPVAVAIYVTGQGSRPARESRIAEIARALYDTYSIDGGAKGSTSNWVNARY